MLSRKCHGDPPQSCYYIHDGCSALRFELAGFLSAEVAAEAEACWRTASSTLASRALLIDLSHLTGTGEPGRRLLQQWYQLGAHFLTVSSDVDELIESITGHPPVQVSVPRSTEPALSLRIAAIPAIVALALLFLIKVWAPGSSAPSAPATAVRARTLHSPLENGSAAFTFRSPNAAARLTEGKR